jgi:transcriptional regulator with XRE-family HTH domain
MPKMIASQRIREEDLAEHWFNCLQIAFGELREAFAQSHLQQEDLAERLGKNKSQISRWLRGVDNVTLRTMSNLARAMGYRLRVVFEPLGSLKRTDNQYFDLARSEAESKAQVNTEGTGAFELKIATAASAQGRM